MRLSLACGLVAATLFPASVQAQNNYVGAKTCARCHDSEARGNMFHRWQASGHARAYQTLVDHTEKEPRACGDVRLFVVEVGKGTRYGLPAPAAESKECLPCHTTAFGADAQRLAAGFDAREGVQCESCHGPGSAHVEAATAGARDKRVGSLKRFGDPRSIREACSGCHEGGSPCGDFDFATMWPKVRHAVAGGTTRGAGR